MTDQTKAKLAEALQAAGIPRKSFSIPQFCARHSIGEGFYRQLRKLGKGPAETKILGRVLISDSDEAAWLEQRKADSNNTTEPA